MRISVAMCTYNGAMYLPQQLSSIAAQTRLPDELVVCDDCSHDATKGIVERFAVTMPFPVRLHVNDANLGSTRNFEKAIALCEGDVIALADQDDVWLKSKLARTEAALVASPDAGLVFSDAEIVDDQLRPTGRCLWEYTFTVDQRRKFGKRGALAVLLTDEVVTGATMAFRAEFKQGILPFPTNMNRIHDGWIALVIAALSEVASVAEPLIKYRQHAQQQLGTAVLTASRPAAATPHVISLREAAIWCEAERETIRQLLTRVAPIGNNLKTQSRVSMIEARIYQLQRQIKHLETRAHIVEASRGLSRATLVMEELMSLRYHQFSKGVASAAKDFAAK